MGVLIDNHIIKVNTCQLDKQGNQIDYFSATQLKIIVRLYEKYNRRSYQHKIYVCKLYFVGREQNF